MDHIVQTPISGKVIFLDIDGCLTSVDDGTSFLCGNTENYGLSAGKLSLLDALLTESGAKVVVSSNWRKFADDGFWIHGGKRFENNLPKLREWLGERYLGDLPYYKGFTKSETLTKWGLEAEVDFSTLDYVVIDDDYDEGFAYIPMFSVRYIHCDCKTGLTKRDIDVALAILDTKAG